MATMTLRCNQQVERILFLAAGIYHGLRALRAFKPDFPLSDPLHLQLQSFPVCS